jgi:hypothetical protein
MLLTTLTILLGTALAAEAGIATHNTLRRELWEPSLAESISKRDTGWQLVETLEVFREEILRGKHDHMRDDTFDEQVAKIAKARDIDYDHYSIDWRFGSVDPKTGQPLGPGWFRPQYPNDYFNVFFYKEPPEPKPVPTITVAPQDKDEQINTIIGFMRHPSAFWLAPDFKGGANLRDNMTPFWSRDPVVPTLRYTRSKTWLAEDHDGLERYCDLQWDANRKNKFKVIYDDDYRKPTYHDNYRSAMIAIAHHFERCFGVIPVEFDGMVRWQLGLALHKPAMHSRLETEQYTKLVRRLSETGLTIDEFHEAVTKHLTPYHNSTDILIDKTVLMVNGPQKTVEFTAEERKELLLGRQRALASQANFS